VNSKVCRFWAERGTCTKGSTCDFSHDYGPTNRDPEVCKFWMSGRCQKGMMCSYRHPVLGGNRQGRYDNYERPGPSTFDAPRSRYDIEPPPPYYDSPRRGFGRSPGSFPVDDYVSPRRREMLENHPGRTPSVFLDKKPRSSKSSTLCKFFQKGNCDRGDNCEFTHRTRPNPEKCKYWGSAPCFKGEYCPFLHTGPGVQEKDERSSKPKRDSSKRKRENDKNETAKKRVRKETEPTSEIDEQDDVLDFGNPPPPALVAKLRESVEIGSRDIQKEEQLDSVLERMDMEACLEVAVQACKKCGELIRNKQDDVKDGKEKISELEEDCTGILATSIASKYPLHAIVGKQNVVGHTAITSAPTWFISAVDGANNLVRGSQNVCVSIGLCVEKRPVLGVIHSPLLNQLVAAYRGGGVILNESDEPIEIKNTRDHKDAVIVSEVTMGDGSSSNGLINMLNASTFCGFRASGSYNHNFLDVLRGVFDGGFQEKCEGPWSLCAGVTVIEEAGGVATDLNGNLFELRMDKQQVVYGPKELVKEMLRYF